MSQRITTRTAAQIRSHAQKYFKKINQDTKDHEHKAIAAPRPAMVARDRRRPTAEQALAALDDTLANLRAKRQRIQGNDRRTKTNDICTLADNELIALEMLCSRQVRVP